MAAASRASLSRGTRKYNDQEYPNQQIHSLQKKVAKLGLQLVPALP
jgi:hypothetical protein